MIWYLQAAPTNDYGQRAHQDLIVTRGAGFRKEKNKKKRGSYKGGEITVGTFCWGLLTAGDADLGIDGESQLQVRVM